MVGASARENRIGGVIPSALRRFGYAGTVIPVNPSHDAVFGFPTVARVADVPANRWGDRAVALVNRPADEVIGHVGALADAGYRAFVVLASGFAEAGGEGVARQRDLVAAAAARDLVVVGPNCPGLATFANGFVACGTTNFRRLSSVRTGGVAIISASGGLGNTTFSFVQERGLGCHSLVGIGNEAVTDAAHLLDFYADDPTCTMVLAYLEQVRDLTRFAAAARKLRAAGKPLVVVKAGRRDSGAASLRTHTGAIAGNGEIARDVLLDLGVVVVDDPAEMADVAMLLQAGVGGSRLGVVSLPGGGKALLADAAEDQGLSVPPVDPATTGRLRPLLPDFAAVENPLDPSAEVSDPARIADVLEIMAGSPAYDTVVFFPLNSDPELAEGIARAVADRYVDGRWPCPLVVIWTATSILEPGAWRVLRERQVPLFVSIGDCFRAMARIRRAARRAAPDHEAREDQPAAEPVAGRLADDPMALLAAEGFPTPARAVLRWADRLAFEWTGAWPVVVKAEHPDLPHRAKAGGVRLGVTDPAGLAAALDDIRAAVKAARGLDVEVFEIQEQLPAGYEWLVSTTHDPEMGRVVSIGAGGALVEIIGDLVHGPPTLDPDRLRQRIAATRMGAGRSDEDLTPLLDVLRRLNALAFRLAAEGVPGTLEVNPVILDPVGRRAVAVDALWLDGASR